MQLSAVHAALHKTGDQLRSSDEVSGWGGAEGACTAAPAATNGPLVRAVSNGALSTGVVRVMEGVQENAFGR